MGLQVGLPIGNLININLNLSAQPLPVQNFSAMLILGPSTVIDVVQRYREYSSFPEVANDFPSNTPNMPQRKFGSVKSLHRNYCILDVGLKLRALDN